LTDDVTEMLHTSYIVMFVGLCIVSVLRWCAVVKDKQRFSDFIFVDMFVVSRPRRKTDRHIISVSFNGCLNIYISLQLYVILYTL